MVDLKKIKTLLEDNFRFDGTYHIDPVTGVVDVQGEVRLISNLDQIPVQFGHVTGDFSCSDSNVTSLQGCPAEVGGHFWTYRNKNLTSLAGAPVKVGGRFDCSMSGLTSLSGGPLEVAGSFIAYQNPFTSLAGAPNLVSGQFVISYAPHLPLLRVLMYQYVAINKSPAAVPTILKKYLGQGRPGALKAAAELIRAGYAENAQW